MIMQLLDYKNHWALFCESAGILWLASAEGLV